MSLPETSNRENNEISTLDVDIKLVAKYDMDIQAVTRNQHRGKRMERVPDFFHHPFWPVFPAWMKWIAAHGACARSAAQMALQAPVELAPLFVPASPSINSSRNKTTADGTL